MPTEKIWKLAESAPAEFTLKFPDFNPILIQLLYSRGLKNKKTAKEFLNPDYKSGLHNPFLIRDMEKAVERIFKAIKKKEKIVIYGDYDADGITAAVLLYKTLKFLGAKHLETYIPHRQKEGYGLNKKIVQALGKRGINLIITVDCGITNVQQIALARKLDIDVIITDHHEVPSRLPSAYAILNVKRKGDQYPFKDLAGVGIAFKLAQALLQKDSRKSALAREAFEKWLLDLVAIGTIADLAPLQDENRTLVKYGLIILNQSKRIGLKKLFQIAGLKPKISPLDTYNIGFQIAPRLNAAGRLHHANTAYQLLLTESEREAEELAHYLEITNRERQKITLDTLKEALEQIGKIEDKRVLLASHPSWSSGIAGLVAGKICDKYHRPTLILERGKEKSVGSARSIENFNITAALSKCQEFLIRFGGHKTAAGFTVETEKISLFYQKLEKIAQSQLPEQDLQPILEVDAELNLDQINWKLFREIEKFQPFGEGNPVPYFLAQNVSLLQIQRVGSEGQHLKLQLRDPKNRIYKAIGFGLGDWTYKLLLGEKIDLVYELLLDEWNGRKNLNLKIIDLKKSN